MNTVQQSPFKKAFRLLVIFFMIVNAIALIFRNRLEDKNVDTDVVIIGNLVLFVVSALATWMYSRAGTQKKAHGMIRNVYGGFMLKFFALIVTAMVYFYFAKEINKPAIFICLGLYLVYNFAGVSQVAKTNQGHHQSQNPHHQKAHHSHK